ncbi:MAG: PTS fructose transporter subunit IIA [Angelakisella sp.]
MVTILLTGHGNFATGLLSAVRLICGTHRQVVAVDFAQEDSIDDLRTNILSVINEEDNDILILTDIAGGSPYNTSVLLKNEFTGKNIEVVSGANIPMLISAIMERGEQSAPEVAENIVEVALHSIKRFQLKKIVQQQVDDGI